MPTEPSAVVIIDDLLKQAHRLHASDLHLDPGPTVLSARLRIDGILKEIRDIPVRLHTAIIARLKILAGLRIDEQHLPQDGRLSFDVTSEVTVDVRVAIAPTYHGERAVLRLLFSSHTLSTPQLLGFSEAQELLLRKALTKEHGMILITGPTGSGKTSTLYSLLHLLNIRSVSITTIEDPIEYALEGINQIPVRPHAGLSFSEALRSVLRQDPNIIGVGEIRDSETAKLAVQGALTGHLVLSTLHTTNASTAILRLKNMGIEPYLISSTITMIINQRLVRRLCVQCKTLKPLRKDHTALLALLATTQKTCEQMYESSGCEACAYTGITGRIGVFEILYINAELRDAISRDISAGELFSIALTQKMLPLLHDGIQKASEGLVHLDEILALSTD